MRADPQSYQYATFMNYARSLTSEIRDSGLKLEFSTDFEELRNVCARLPSKCQVTDVFNPDKFDIGPHNGFWLCGRDSANEIVHIQAMRVDNIMTNLADHWKKSGDAYRIPTHDVIPDETVYNAAPAAMTIKGSVAYHGEFFISPGSEGFRQHKLHGKLSMVAVLTASARFETDYIYGFITRPNVLRGLCAQFGYIHAFPYSVRWKLRGQSEPFDEYLVWTTSEEVAQLVKLANQPDPHILGSVSETHDRRSPSDVRITCN